MSTPSTFINVCRVPFSNDYQHVVYFNTGDEQVNYFNAKTVKQFTDYSQVRKNWALKVNASIVQAEKWNYLFFVQNYKRYFYFITNVKYISDETVELSLEMDVMQTYMFDYDLKPSFVEREHSATDNVGENTLDEGLELGLYVDTNKSSPDLFNNMSVMMMTTEPIEVGGGSKRAIRDGIFTGCFIYSFNTATSNFSTRIHEWFNATDERGKTESIISMWMYPRDLVRLEETDETLLFSLVSESKFEGVEYYVPWNNTNIDGYTPRNKKLLGYPYSLIYVTDNKGNTAQYRYEQFESSNPYFVIDGSIYPDGGVKITPVNYKGAGFNYDESLTFTGFPTCPWSSDTYKIWLAQNQNQHAVGYTKSGISVGAGALMTVAGALTVNPALAISGAGMVVGGMTSIASQIAQKEDMKVQPDQAHGGSSNTLNTAIGLFVTFHNRTITKERAQIIDEFFTMYGYKTLRVKIPNRNVRKAFTYTKTTNCYITGELCQEDIRKIQNIYNNGVTFWNKNATIGDYTVDNSTLI